MRDEQSTNDAPPPRKRLTAVAAAIVLPGVIGAFGAGHFYAREYRTGFLLLAVAWLGIACGAAADPAFFLIAPLVVLADAVGAVRTIGRPRA